MTTSISTSVKVADEVWIATALLHLEYPERSDFRVSEILQTRRTGRLNRRASSWSADGCHTALRGEQKAQSRSVPNAHRNAPRLQAAHRPSDPVYTGREHGKIMPDRYEIPERYEYLLQWYSREYAGKQTGSADDPLLRLRGTAKGIYGDPDEYVRELREGWE